MVENKENKIESHLVDVSQDNQLTVQTNSKFKEILGRISAYNQEAGELLTDYRQNPDEFVEKTDEEVIIEMINDGKDVKTFVKDINETIKAVRKYYNDQRDDIVDQIKSELSTAGFDELEQAESDIRQLRKDMLEQRKENRWKQLEEVFNRVKRHYPDLEDKVPELVDFDRYRERNPKLVSGSANGDVGSKEFKKIEEDLATYDVGLSVIMQNQWGLSVNSLIQLTSGFASDGTIQYIHTQGANLKQRELDHQANLEREAKERARREAEKQRLAKERAEKERQMKAQLEAAKREKDAKRKEELERQAQKLREESYEAAKRQEKERKEQELLIDRYINPRFKQLFPQTVAYLVQTPATKALVTAEAKAMATIHISALKQQNNSPIASELATPDQFNQAIRFIQDLGSMNYD